MDIGYWMLDIEEQLSIASIQGKKKGRARLAWRPWQMRRDQRVLWAIVGDAQALGNGGVGGHYRPGSPRPECNARSDPYTAPDCCVRSCIC